ncbi:MAG: APC family permease, partial [Armatimonadetes bacterium]|nr:APC family permease [Armatimonadota bacterium]
TGTSISMVVCVAIVVLLAIVATSYRQTIFSYPSGGGSYIVAKDNLGVLPGLTAGAALMIDYVLTVAVSVSSGVAAILSFLPQYHQYREAIALAIVAFIALANLRGVRESGLLFATPTYTFLGTALALIVMGMYRFAENPAFMIPAPPAHSIPIAHPPATQWLLYFLVLRAFSSGCSAMTGTEAISNGIPAFRPPESKNAATTLVWMAVILGAIFTGITYIAWRAHVIPMDQNARGYETVLSQIAGALVGKTSWFYYLFQAATCGILVIAANTSFADFPRLGSIMARDRFLPRQLYNVGDRLVFSNGIALLAVLASVLIVVFKGEVNALIPLYAIGVFLSFTLSQAGMVKHFIRLKERGWRRSAVISAIGATVTAIVVLVQATTKASEGAWIVIILIPTLVLIFLKINRHYVELGNQLRLTPDDKFVPTANTVLVLTPSIHRGVLPALEFARSLSTDVRAVHIDTDPLDASLLEQRWEEWSGGIPLVILESPYRSLLGPLLEYIKEVKQEREDHITVVVIPEFVSPKWWHRLLHNQSGLLLKFVLMFQPGIITTNVRYYLPK